MAGIEFDVIITDEGVNYARQAQGGIGSGWHLTPKRFEISSIESANFSKDRNLSSRNDTWISRSFSGIYPLETNKLLMNITIPPDARGSSIAIKEIYFIFENHTDDASAEFLFAIAKPTISLEYIPGVSQSFKFVFAINNVKMESIIDIVYTYPEEILDHNLDLNAHIDFLMRNGKRTATGILSYDEAKNFTQPNQIVTKKYVDDATEYIKNYVERDAVINIEYLE